MKFSYEEIFSSVGQYDTVVMLEFDYGCDDFLKFGSTLIGVFLYGLDERINLIQVLELENIPRTDRKVRFKPSITNNLTIEQKIELDKNGITCSNIRRVSYLNLPQDNRFQKQGKKEIPNLVKIKTEGFSGWRELNFVKFNFLNYRFLSGQRLAPLELSEYLGLRSYYEYRIDDKIYIDLLYNASQELAEGILYYELVAKCRECCINDEEMKVLHLLLQERLSEKKKIINEEMKMSTTKMSTFHSKYPNELNKLLDLCLYFEEEILLYGDVLVYLNFERFVHIFARHVVETQIGERYSNIKTVFEYGLDDIKKVIKMVLGHLKKDIKMHFSHNPNKNFLRMGNRSVYVDGHHYRIEIAPSGLLKSFHPYNDKK